MVFDLNAYLDDWAKNSVFIPEFGMMTDFEIVEYWFKLYRHPNWGTIRMVFLAKIKQSSVKSHLYQLLERIEKDPDKYRVMV